MWKEKKERPSPGPLLHYSNRPEGFSEGKAGKIEVKPGGDGITETNRGTSQMKIKIN